MVAGLLPGHLGACALLATSVSPDLIKAMHVMTWIIFDCTYMITTIQLLALGAYIVLNKRQATFPPGQVGALSQSASRSCHWC